MTTELPDDRDKRDKRLDSLFEKDAMDSIVSRVIDKKKSQKQNVNSTTLRANKHN